MKYEKGMNLEVVKRTSSGHEYALGEIVSFIEYYSNNYVVVRSYDGKQQTLHLDEVRYSSGVSSIPVKKISAKDTNVNKVEIFKEEKPIILNKETHKMMESIMNHHRITYIDKCLDERNFDGLLKLNND